MMDWALVVTLVQLTAPLGGAHEEFRVEEVREAAEVHAHREGAEREDRVEISRIQRGVTSAVGSCLPTATIAGSSQTADGLPLSETTDRRRDGVGGAVHRLRE